jgi:hypothetical protein
MLLLLACRPDIDLCDQSSLEEGTCTVNLQKEAYAIGYAKGQEDLNALVDARLEELGLKDAAAKIDALEGRVESVEAIDNDQDVALTELETRLVDVEATLGDYGITLTEVDSRLVDAEGSLADPSSIGMVSVISADTTWTAVDEAELEARIAALDYYRIAEGVTLTIELSIGKTYNFQAPLSIGHPDGHRLKILGDENDPSTTVLSFTGSDGIIVEDGSIGYLGGITIEGDSVTSADGIRVTANSFLGLGPLVVQYFGDDGIEVEVGRIKEAISPYSGWLVLKENGGDGLLVNSLGSASVGYIQANSNYLYGIAAEGGYIDAGYGEATYNGAAGFQVIYAGVIVAGDATASNNAGDGFYTAYHGFMDVRDSTAKQNDDDGFAASSGATLYGYSTFSTNNISNGYQSTGGAVMVIDMTTATDNGGSAYRTTTNGFITGSALNETTIDSSAHNVDDFVQGIP